MGLSVIVLREFHFTTILLIIAKSTCSDWPDLKEARFEIHKGFISLFFLPISMSNYKKSR